MMSTPASQQGAIPIRDETAGSRLVSMAKSLLWLTLLAVPLVSATQAAVINEIAIAALFALSLDLVLGFAGIVSLGHAAFFGIGAYAAGLFARHVHPDPLAGLAVAMFAGAALGAVASLGILRGTQLTRLMITLGVALLVTRRDSFGASIAFCLLGFSVMDMGHYMHDAGDPQMMMVNGESSAETDGHDFINIFSAMGGWWLQHATTIGIVSGRIGEAMMLIGIAWGAYMLWLQKANLSDSAFAGSPLDRD
jgi:hypothetical protein